MFLPAYLITHTYNRQRLSLILDQQPLTSQEIICSSIALPSINHSAPGYSLPQIHNMT